jgi:hypothetical protein
LGVLQFFKKVNSFDSKGDEPLKVGIFRHVKEGFPVDSIGGENDIIFSDHKEVIVDVGEEPVIFDIVVEPVQDKIIHYVIVKVLCYKVSLFVLTDDMKCLRVDVNSGATLSRQLVFDRIAIVWQRIKQKLVSSQNV